MNVADLLQSIISILQKIERQAREVRHQTAECLLVAARARRLLEEVTALLSDETRCKSLDVEDNLRKTEEAYRRVLDELAFVGKSGSGRFGSTDTGKAVEHANEQIDLVSIIWRLEPDQSKEAATVVPVVPKQLSKNELLAQRAAELEGPASTYVKDHLWIAYGLSQADAYKAAESQLQTAFNMYNKAASNGLQTFGVARCQLRLGQIALKRREVPSAISHFGEARGIFQAFKFDPGTAEALEGLAFADWLRYKLPEARKHAEWSLKLREAQPDQLVISRSLMLLGDLDNTEFHVQEAEARYTRALEIRRGLATERPLAECLDSLSKLYAGRGELDRAELMLKESLKLKTDVDDEIGCAVTQFSLAKIACRRNQIPDGIQSMEKVLAAAREEGNKELSGSVLLFLGFVNRQLGKTELARNHLEEGTKIFLEELGHLKLLKLMAVAGLTILASIDVKENRLTKAEKWIHLAQDLADNTRSKPALQAVYAVRLELCSAQGNHREVEKMEKKIEQLKQETGNVLIEFSLRSFLRTFGWF